MTIDMPRTTFLDRAFALSVSLTMTAACVRDPLDDAGSEDGGASSQEVGSDDGSATGDPSSSDASTSSESGDAEDDGETSTDSEGAPDCWQHFEQVACEAESERCQFGAAGELLVVNGECTVSPEPVGWCPLDGWGGSSSPYAWYEVATGRVFQFALAPFTHPPGWEPCACEPPAPEACLRCASYYGSTCDEMGAALQRR